VAQENVPLGSFEIEGLPPKPAGDVEVEVHFDFDLNGILTVTATEKGMGQQKSLVVNDTKVGRLSSHELNQARQQVSSLFESLETIDIDADWRETEDEDRLNLEEE
jgi:molecular chaperone DnaK